jgi:hypothetical protein
MKLNFRLETLIIAAILVIASASPKNSSAVTRTPTPTPTPVPVTTVDYTPIKQDIQTKGASLIREIDLYINPKAKDKGCTNRVLRSREKALSTSDDLFTAAALMPDINFRGTLTGLFCTKINAAQPVNATRRSFSSLVRAIATLVRLEKTCKAKYGLSYPPNYSDVSQVNRELNTIPRIVYICD